MLRASGRGFELMMAVEQELGPAIVPSKTAKTGQAMADRPRARRWTLLLTCDTVSEARDKTNERLAAAGERE